MKTEIRKLRRRSAKGAYGSVHLRDESFSSVGECPPADHCHCYHADGGQEDRISGESNLSNISVFKA
jgi:hypothetical protein